MRHGKAHTLTFTINPLSANVEYTPHGGDATCSGCGASYRQDH